MTFNEMKKEMDRRADTHKMGTDTLSGLNRIDSRKEKLISQVRHGLITEDEAVMYMKLF